MTFQRFTLAVAAMIIGTTANAVWAQQSVMMTDKDDFTFRGCVRRADLQSATASAPPKMLVWSRGDIMLDEVTALGAKAPDTVGTSGTSQRVFYWLDNHDDKDLASHVGQMVEVDGHLKNFEISEVKIEEHGDLTDIKLKVGGHEEKARVPTSWLKTSGDRKFGIITRRVDVHKVRLLGACN
jgi:hypothetical protein